MKQSIKQISGFILATIGIIFLVDSYWYFTYDDTISEVITNWIGASTTNLIIFISGVVLLSVHWIFGKYKE